MASSNPTSPLPPSHSRSLHQVSKKRKAEETTVVRVKIEANSGDSPLSPPPDSWSWRKYGQKPIRGSPHLRGYYRCSTTKGCTAKKQVERCKDDGSVVVITYTSPHNHPAPEPTAVNMSQKRPPKKKGPTSSDIKCMQSPKHSSNEAEGIGKEEVYVVSLDTCESLDNSPMPTMLIKQPQPEESYDFYDALHDLDFSSISSFTS